MVMFVRIATLLLANSLVIGCAYLPTSSSDTLNDTDAHISPAPAELETVIDDRPFPAPTLYSLLVAEVAGQRQQFDVSLINYLDQAEKTQDPGIAERATRIAQYMGVNNYTLKAATIWVENDPFEAQAHQVLAQALMIEGDFSAALVHMEAVLELAGASQFDYLALNAQHLTVEQKRNLLQQFEVLTGKHPDYPQLWMAKGTLLLQLEDYSSALPAFDQACLLYTF